MTIRPELETQIRHFFVEFVTEDCAEEYFIKWAKNINAELSKSDLVMSKVFPADPEKE